MTVIGFVGLWAGLAALMLIVLMLPRLPTRWLEGWMMPHAEPRLKCWVKCGTCSRETVDASLDIEAAARRLRAEDRRSRWLRDG